MNNTHIVILAGGIGNKFWPLSKKTAPKQFLDLLGIGQTLLQFTFERFKEIAPLSQIWVVCHQIHQNLVEEQLPELPSSNLILEPIRKNTSASVAYAIWKIGKKDPNATAIIVPSDRLILNESGYVQSFKMAIEHAINHQILVTLGIKPKRISQRHGWIQLQVEPTKNGPVAPFYLAKTFMENPPEELSEMFMKSGEFVWSSGFTIGCIAAFKANYKQYLPEMHELFEEGNTFYNQPREQNFIKKTYEYCEFVSFKYSILFKTKQLHVLTTHMAWTNLGSFNTLWEVHGKDYVGNSVTGKQVIMYNATGCLVHVPENKLTVIQGLEDYMVIDSGDVLLIYPKKDEADLPNVLQDVKRLKGDHYL